MQRVFETEYKFLIDKTSFEIAHRAAAQTFLFLGKNTQINYYYDTAENLFYHRQETVRIRQREDCLQLQIKVPRCRSGPLCTRAEHVETLRYLPQKIALDNNEVLLNLKGQLVTVRTDYRFGQTGILSFDCSMYLGLCDYEIEIEFKTPDMEFAQQIVREWGLTSHASRNKSERFFMRLEEWQYGQD